MGNGEMFIDGEKVADIKVESHRRIVEFKIAERYKKNNGRDCNNINKKCK